MHKLIAGLPPAIIALLLQFAAVLLAATSVHLASLQLSPTAFVLLCGLLAALLGHFAGLARWWLPIQFLFMPAAGLLLTFDIPPAFFLAGFLTLLVVYWSTFRTQVPLYLSSNKVWEALETLLPAPPRGNGEEREPNFRFIDLGCGLGGVLTHLASVRPDGHYCGVESAPLPFMWSWLRIRLGGHHNCDVRWGSLWNCNLAHYDVVFAYLSPVPMERLWLKARAEMRPETIFISSTFTVPEQTPHQILQVDDLHHSTLLVWRM